jgi:hypothetical protein
MAEKHFPAVCRSLKGEVHGVSSDYESIKTKDKRQKSQDIEEDMILRSQIAISSWGGSRYRTMVFTEQGISMLSSVLHRKMAIAVNIRIVRAFVRMRKILESHSEILKKLEDLERKDAVLDEKVSAIFEYLRQLEQSKQEETDFRTRKRISYKTSS